MKVSSLCFLSLLAVMAEGFAPTTLLTTNNARATSSLSMSSSSSSEQLDRRSVLLSSILASAALLTTASPSPASARLEAVDRPDLLPTEKGLNVIQTEKFLTSGQAKRMDTLLANLEKDTGFRVRVLCQSYPNTPGLAIRDYWSLGKEVSKQNTHAPYYEHAGGVVFRFSWARLSICRLLCELILFFLSCRVKRMTNTLSWSLINLEVEVRTIRYDTLDIEDPHWNNNEGSRRHVEI